MCGLLLSRGKENAAPQTIPANRTHPQIIKPVRAEENIFCPTAAIVKEGAGKKASRLSTFRSVPESRPDPARCAASLAPTGYPPNKAQKSSPLAPSESPNSRRAVFDKTPPFSSVFSKPERYDEAIIKGKSDGINVSVQSRSELRTPSAAGAEKKISRIADKTVKATTVFFRAVFMRINSQ